MQPFISHDDLGLYLRKDLTSDQVSTIALDSACQIVRDYLNQEINFEADDTVTLDGTGTQILVLPELPIVEVASVSTFADWTHEETVLDPITDWRLGDAGRIWRVGYAWPLGFANISVTYSHGWDIDPASGSGDGDKIPSSIRAVALSIASRLYSAGVVAVGGIQSETMGQYSYSISPNSASGGELSVGEKAILDQYRHRAVA
jgi:hypothetical protein